MRMCESEMNFWNSVNKMCHNACKVLFNCFSCLRWVFSMTNAHKIHRHRHFMHNPLNFAAISMNMDVIAWVSPHCGVIRLFSSICGCPRRENSCNLCPDGSSVPNVDTTLAPFAYAFDGIAPRCDTMEAYLHSIDSEELQCTHVQYDILLVLLLGSRHWYIMYRSVSFSNALRMNTMHSAWKHDVHFVRGKYAN